MHNQIGAPDPEAPPPDPTERRAAAFFGLDTLIPGSSLYLLAQGLQRRHFYARSDLLAFALRRLTLGAAPGPSKTRASSDSALSFVAGRDRPALRALATEIADERILP